MSGVRDNCRLVLDRIHKATAGCSRDPAAIRLIAVTKTVDTGRIREAVECGISDIGENRLQEALSKRDGLQDLALRWHFIGRLQTNKAKKATETFDDIQSVDRIELARKLNVVTPRLMPILVEVNLGEEPSKSGVREQDLEALIAESRELKMLELRGLMTVPPFSGDSEGSRPYFRRLRALAEQFDLKELSMGMSQDFEVAIEEGATMVRVGAALFGSRA